MPYENGQENMLEFIYIYRNKLNALFGDDPEFNIYEIGEPLPDGTIERRKDGRTLNIVSSNMAKLTIARDHLGNVYENGEKLYIDYYYGRTNDNTTGFVNIEDRPTMNEKLATQLDIAMLFEGNPHFSEFYSGVGQMGPWYCVAFKPELIQYHNDDGASLYGVVVLWKKLPRKYSLRRRMKIFVLVPKCLRIIRIIKLLLAVRLLLELSTRFLQVIGQTALPLLPSKKIIL